MSKQDKNPSCELREELICRWKPPTPMTRLCCVCREGAVTAAEVGSGDGPTSITSLFPLCEKHQIQLLREAPIFQRILRCVVDVAWNEANEDESVPSTEWADRMIERALKEFEDE